MQRTPAADMPYLSQIDSLDFHPIFIQGLHRSGTSILYKMLSATESLNPISAYHLIQYDELLYNHIHNHELEAKQALTADLQHKGVADRGIDKLIITADFAEEYGFHLDRVSQTSKLRPGNLESFISLARKIQYISGNAHPVLFKNPYDFSNFLFIKKTLPSAKFIFIHRHPFRVISSLIKAIRILFQSHNVYATYLSRIYRSLYGNPLTRYGVRFLSSEDVPFGTMLLTLNTTLETRRYLHDVPSLTHEDYICITYEQLCTDPQNTMTSLLNFIDIKPQKPQDFTQFIKPRETALDPTVDRTKHLIYASMKEYCDTFSYAPTTY